MDIPNTAVGLLVGAGVLLILASLFGGGLEIKEIKIPTITLRARLLSFVVGTGLIALAIMPEMNFVPNGENGAPTVTQPGTEDDDSQLIELRRLTGIPVEEAHRDIVSLGVTVGAVDRRSEWAPDGFVVEQSPAKGTLLSTGDKVDLTVADSNFRFRSQRRVRSADENLTVLAEYAVRRIRLDSGSGDIGEIVLTRLEATPTQDDFSRVANRLVSTSAYIPLGTMDDFNLIASWEALYDYQQELGATLQVQKLTEDQPGFAGLGEGILLMLLIMELEFDIRSIFTAPPALNGNDSKAIDLQVGTELKSSIRLQGRPSIVAAGETHSFEVARRTKKVDAFKNVGRATYSARDGLLRRLSASFYIGTTEDAYLQIEITRL
jgi:hypothetical protein